MGEREGKKNRERREKEEGGLYVERKRMKGKSNV